MIRNEPYSEEELNDMTLEELLILSNAISQPHQLLETVTQNLEILSTTPIPTPPPDGLSSLGFNHVHKNVRFQQRDLYPQSNYPY